MTVSVFPDRHKRHVRNRLLKTYINGQELEAVAGLAERLGQTQSALVRRLVCDAIAADERQRAKTRAVA